MPTRPLVLTLSASRLLAHTESAPAGAAVAMPTLPDEPSTKKAFALLSLSILKSTSTPPSLNTASVGDKSLSVTLGGTAATEDQYKDGYVYVNDGTGEGHIYKIRQHDAINSSAAGTINLYDGDAIAVAFEDATIVGLAKNPYKDFIVYPTTSTGHAVGVAATDFDDDDFGWLQTWGPAAVLCDVAFVIGNHVRVSDNQAGAGEPLDRDGTHENEETIGVASLIAPVTTDYGYVNLTINP